jgi:hypothetical protein
MCGRNSGCYGRNRSGMMVDGHKNDNLELDDFSYVKKTGKNIPDQTACLILKG